MAGLGGALDGYDIEHAGTCSAGFTYEINTKTNLNDTGLTAEYLTVFKPQVLLKVWAR